MPADPLAPNRFTKAARAALRLGSDPSEVLEKINERVAGRRERFTRRGQEPQYVSNAGWEERLHRLLGAEWPCPAAHEFSQLWDEVAETMRSQGLRLGRQSYGGDDDADPGLSRALWCLVRHLRPENIVETGVGHGVSSRCMLEALERNGAGRLWSIDLPPLTIPERRREIGVAVLEQLRGRWTYIEGSSRRRLPPLLDQLGEIQLFCHDSWHSTRNTRWELNRAWARLPAGGAVVADDIDHNWGFKLFAEATPDCQALHCEADDGQRLFGIGLKASDGAAAQAN